MTWFRVDDAFYNHYRVEEAGNAAVGLWVRAGAYCMAHLTDGYVRENIAKALGKPSEIKRLVDTGLWLRVDGGYEFFRWHEDAFGQKRQETREEAEARRRGARDRQAKRRAKTATVTPDLPVSEPDPVTRDSRVTHTTQSHTPVTRPSSSSSSSTSSSEGSDEPSLSPREARSVRVTEGEWARWWDAYPRRQDKVKAKAAYKRARERGATTDELLAGAERYRDDPNRDPGFTKIPTTWLNAGSWDDDPLPPREPHGAPVLAERPMKRFT